MEGGGLSVTGQASLAGAGVIIYSTGGAGFGNGALRIETLGAVDLSAPTTGPWEGIGLFQERTDAANKIQIAGNSNVQIGGTVYARDAEVKLAGNGTGDILAGAFIASTMDIVGNGDFAVSGGQARLGIRVAFLVE
jgi:hypothetical protein